MMRFVGIVTGLAFALAPAIAWAEGAGGGYKGIAQIYYTFISAVLIYGVHDTFHNKTVTWIAVIVIPVVMYGFLLPKG